MSHDDTNASTKAVIQYNRLNINGINSLRMVIYFYLKGVSTKPSFTQNSLSVV